ncbi:uncharacterized protein LY89DRAFT_743062 [Mollisia scopiformis]|uniref:Chitin-binding type-1 domain-containing protein n=1 Tax=Mollisia scopiformis TaxID=149040 RepID=A0A132B4V8_MOLSC|nr:uncharacterized protein LY89DRAFT_743062 [Mollisia scopiformis]KUJ07442.1 hypothetical protein LY89DRAFT_743062 [Mollisia scopiformis]
MRAPFIVLPLLAIGVASDSILESLGFGMLESGSLLQKYSRLLRRQSSSNGTCRLSLQTDIWTSCAALLSEFNLTLDYFKSANPNIGANCANFQPGATYCLSVPSGSPIPVSTNGLCGAQQNWTNTCIGSSAGACCGIGGFCGTGEIFCGLGVCQEGTCDGAPIPYSTDGTCGSQIQWTECPPQFGDCCSEFGFCGNGTTFCGTGCQSGTCTDSTVTTTTTTTSAHPTQTAGSISTDGTCGFSGGLICKGSTFGSCCSSAGYCGSTEYACLDILGCTASVPTSSSAAATKTSSGTTTIIFSTAPGPTQTGIAANCNAWVLQTPGLFCADLATEAGISLSLFYTLNPAVNNAKGDCQGLLAGDAYCVGTTTTSSSVNEQHGNVNGY